MTFGHGERIAVFGGSFDPPHVGHVLVMAYVRATADVDRILMVPTFEHPLDKRAAAGFEHRVQMCELLVDLVGGTRVSRIEEELGGPSRTLRTLQELQRRDEHVRLRLVVGADVLRETHRWHAWERIVEIAPPIVVGRAGYERPEDSSVEMPDISSTELRRRLARDRATAGLLPLSVERYIVEHDLYLAEEHA